VSGASFARAPLTGLAVGDALGMPFETAYADAYVLVQWKGGYVKPAPPNHHKLEAGQFTDDTQMSMALAEHLVEHGFYDPGKAAEKYLDWYRSGDCRGIGTSTRKALERMAAGAPWHDAGEKGAEGNGSAMRAGMIGVFHHRGMQRLGAAADWARVDARVTHRSEEAAEASAAMAVALSHLSSGGSREELLDVVLSQTQKTRVHFALEDLSRTIRTHKERGMGNIFREWIMEANYGPRGPSARACESVPAAFAAFLSAKTFLETVESAIRAGGDTDSVASMAGSMAGAFWGLHNIPEDLVNGLERHDEIRQLELHLLGAP
jgi:ADP-ribosylglycohydrolase